MLAALIAVAWVWASVEFLWWDRCRSAELHESLQLYQAELAISLDEQRWA